MLKKGLYVLVSMLIIFMMTGLHAPQTLQQTDAPQLSYFPLDGHPPEKTAVIRAKVYAKDLRNGDASKTNKVKHRGKCAYNNFRYDDVVPFNIPLSFNGAMSVTLLIKQHIRTVMEASLPKYYAHLFRLTPF